MFTVEFEHDATIVTTIDESGLYDDVQTILGTDMQVFIRQYSEELEEHQVICMGYQQLLDIFHSMKQTEGAYYLTLKTVD